MSDNDQQNRFIIQLDDLVQKNIKLMDLKSLDLEQVGPFCTKVNY
jgi:hypothetical protein